MASVWLIERKAKVPTFPGDHEWSVWLAKGVFKSEEDAKGSLGSNTNKVLGVEEGQFSAIYNFRVKEFVHARPRKKKHGKAKE